MMVGPELRGAEIAEHQAVDLINFLGVKIKGK